jgi:hypothetical protein
LLIYQDGNLIDYPYARFNAAGQQEVSLGLHLDKGSTYSFVVFGANGTSLGNFRFTSTGTPEGILKDMTMQNFGGLIDSLDQVPPYLSVTPDVGVVGDLHQELPPYVTLPPGGAVDLASVTADAQSQAGGSGADVVADPGVLARPADVVLDVAPPAQDAPLGIEVLAQAGPALDVVPAPEGPSAGHRGSGPG